LEWVRNNPPTSSEGILFEAASGLLLSATPGFEVRQAFKEPDEQVDLLIQHMTEPGDLLPSLEGYGLVECRATSTAVGAPEVRDFGAKCVMRGVKYGIVASLSRITGRVYDAAQLTRRKFFLQNLALLVIDQASLGQALSRADVLAT